MGQWSAPVKKSEIENPNSEIKLLPLYSHVSFYRIVKLRQQWQLLLYR